MAEHNVTNNARSFDISDDLIILWTFFLFFFLEKWHLLQSLILVHKLHIAFVQAWLYPMSCINPDMMLAPKVLPFPFLELEATAVKMTQMYCENLPLSKDLDAQESMYGEDLLSMACNLLVQVRIFPYGIIVLYSLCTITITIMWLESCRFKLHHIISNSSIVTRCSFKWLFSYQRSNLVTWHVLLVGNFYHIESVWLFHLKKLSC